MPWLPESQPERGFNKMKLESDDSLPLSASTTFADLHHQTSSLLTPTQLLAASQTAAFIAASGLPVSLNATLSTNPNLFHPSLFAAAAAAGHLWGATPQTSPPPSAIQTLASTISSTSPISPNAKAYKLNNNNIVTSSSGINENLKGGGRQRKAARKLIHQEPDKSPTSPSQIVVDLVPTSIINGQLSPPNSGSSSQSSSSGCSITGSIKDSSSATVGSSAYVNRNSDKQFVCDVCNRSFGYKHVLQNHKRTHTGEKPFKCPQCHKRFTRDHHLKTHMRLHTGERPYSCSYCDRKFVQVANLRRHLRVHTGEKPYNCTVCQVRFSDSNQLKAHNLIHKGEKPFQCDRCKSRFRRRHHLMHHKCSIDILATSPVDISSSDQALLANSGDKDVPEDLSKENRSRKAVSDNRQHVINRIPIAPLIRLPVHVTFPEQTEPEDLSMSTGHNHSTSSGVSDSPPLSRRSTPTTATSTGSSTHIQTDVEDEVEENHSRTDINVPTSHPDLVHHNTGSETVEDDELDEAATLFLKRRALSRLQHDVTTSFRN